MAAFITFMEGTWGRVLRVILGLILVYFGWTTGGTTGWIILIIGLVPLLMGIWGPCLVGLILKKK